MIKYQLRCTCEHEFEGWFPSSKEYIRQKIKKDYQDVGKNFAKEARKAHKGKRDQKFYGKPTKEETNKLLDEGIDLFAVPDYKDN
jgi:hypothetical protein